MDGQKMREREREGGGARACLRMCGKRENAICL